jgi:hypothetical protein
MGYNRKLRTKDYISLMIIAISAFKLIDISYLAFGYGCVIVFASLSLGTLFIDNKK